MVFCEFSGNISDIQVLDEAAAIIKYVGSPEKNLEDCEPVEIVAVQWLLVEHRSVSVDLSIQWAVVVKLMF